jgi:RNA polymerase sigma-70 factor (ECF subfamily)
MSARSNVVRLHRAGTTGRTTLSDETLVAACAAGDVAALGALYDRHHEAVFRFVTRLSGGDRGEVDDMVQETFVGVRTAASKFRGGSQVRTWLFGIAVNVVRHAKRAHGRHRSMLDALRSVPLDPARSPDAEVHGVQLRNAVAAAVAMLPHELRTVFVMMDLEELSGAEVAAVLRVPEGTVFRRRHDARRELRAVLGDVR